jgi:hypothetical protein
VALEELARIEATLADVDLGDRGDLVGPLRRAHADLTDTIERAERKLDEGRDLAEPVRDLLKGPSTLLLLAANNAEMAGGSGLALSAGALSIVDGEIELGDVVAAGELRLEDSVPLPGDLGSIYRPTGIGIDFRSSTRSPDLPTMGPVIDAMVSRLDPELIGTDDVDGVIVVDALALRDVLALTGPVEVDGEEIDASTVLADVLHDNYVQFATTGERAERVSYQGDIAKAAFEALTERDVPAADLAQVLLDSSRGRHVMVWAEDDDLQDVWQELGIDGSVDPNGLLISWQNYAANKMDWYLRPEATFDVSLTPSGDYRARLVMRMEVPALEELDDASPYILGPTPDRQGTFLTVHLPADAYDITTPDPPGFRTKGDDGPMQARTFLVDVPAGQTFERTVEFSLPRDVGALLLLPSARVEPVPLTIDGIATITDAEPTVFSWLAAIEGQVTGTDDGVPAVVRLLVVIGLLCTLASAAALATSMVRPSRAPAGIVVAAQSTAVLALLVFSAAGITALLMATPRV